MTVTSAFQTQTHLVRRGADTVGLVARTYRTLHGMKYGRLTPQEAGRSLAEDALAMGPLYTKLAQFVSARTDALDPDFIAALSVVQDSAPAPAADPPHVAGVVVDQTPIASASIADVYSGVHVASGRRVAVKQRRAGCKDLVQTDLPLLTGVMRVAAVAGLPGAANMAELIDQSRSMVLGELDFRNEAASAREFRVLMKDIPWLVVPRILSVTEDVLVSEFVESRRLVDVITPNSGLATRLMDLYMQMLSRGFVHADPHPGNLGFRPDGTVVLYDFGAMLRVGDVSRHVARAITAGVTKDAEGVLRALEDLDVVRISDPGQRSGARRVLQRALRGDVHMELQKAPEFASSVRGVRVVQFSETFVYLARTLTLINAACQRLDPAFEYDFTEYIDAPDGQDAMSAMTAMARDAAAIPSTVQAMHTDLEAFQSRIITEIDDMKRSGSTLTMMAVVLALVAKLL